MTATSQRKRGRPKKEPALSPVVTNPPVQPFTIMIPEQLRTCLMARDDVEAVVRKVIKEVNDEVEARQALRKVIRAFEGRVRRKSGGPAPLACVGRGARAASASFPGRVGPMAARSSRRLCLVDLLAPDEVGEEAVPLHELVVAAALHDAPLV